MNKRGFTLVELLAVISILALLLVITVPAVMNSRNNAIKGISKEEENSIKEAGKLVGIDLDDYTSEIYNCKEGSWIESNCTLADGNWIEAKITIDELEKYNYFDDTQNHCSGVITVTKVESGYKVTLNNIKCN